MSDPASELKAELMAAARRQQAAACASSSIERRRGGARRWRHLAALAATLIFCGTAVAAAVRLTGERSAPLSGTLSHLHRGGSAHPRSSARYWIAMTPDLQAGHTGWCDTTVIGIPPRLGLGGGCGPAPLAGKHLIAGASTVASGNRLLDYAIVDSHVASVIFDGRRVRASHMSGLPRGWKAAVTVVGFHARHRGRPGEIPGAPATESTLLNAAGHPLAKARRGQHVRAIPTRAVSAAHPPAGRCSIHHAHPLPGLKALAAKTIRGRPRRQPDLNGPAFTSCAESTFTLHGSTLVAAVLLNASHPDRPVAALPGAKPAHGAPGMVEVDTGLSQQPPTAYFPRSPAFPQLGPLTARRAGRSWLAVEGGSGHQRDALLAALTPGGAAAARTRGP